LAVQNRCFEALCLLTTLDDDSLLPSISTVVGGY
jgi:hypothetical protein